jgi:WD40 repeat protein
MLYRCVMLILSLFVSYGAEYAFPQSKPIEGMYARHAVPVFDMFYSKVPEPKAVSPDGKKIVLARYPSDSDDMELTLRNGGEIHVWNLGTSVGAEISWAPDSRAFFVTRSPAGRNGMYFLTVYVLDDDKIRILDPTPIIYEAFGHPVRCDTPEEPNVAGVAWHKNSQRLLVAAEIVSHSNCDSNGTFEIYELSIPELKILKKYSQLEAKKLFWGSLGWELRPADDNCIRHPKSCLVHGYDPHFNAPLSKP